MSKILKYGFVAAVFTATLGMISSAFAQGVDVLRGGGGAQPNYVTDNMLLNAHVDPMNWMHYGKTINQLVIIKLLKSTSLMLLI